MRAFLVFALMAACGGAQSEQAVASSAPAPGPGVAASNADPAAYSALTEFFAKKRPIVSQCYGTAIENRELKEDAKGRVKLALTVMPSGQAKDVRVAETTLSSKPVEDCVVALVQKWTLPAPDRPIQFLYTYEFSNQ